MDTVSRVMIGVFTLMCLYIFWWWFCFGPFMLKRQKTRSPQQRRMYGTRQRPSLAPQEPTIYVSPANLPPPPKYEAMAPPSYEEVVGVHSPYYQSQMQPSQAQPISQPITNAMAQTSISTRDSTVVTVTTIEPRRTSLVAASA